MVTHRTRVIVVITMGVVLTCGIVPGGTAQEVHGQAVDSLSGLPIPSASVTLWTEAGRVDSSTTNRDGWFVLIPPSRGAYHMRLSAPGYRLSRYPAFDVTPGATLTFQLLVTPLDIGADSLVRLLCPTPTEKRAPVLTGLVRNAAGQPVPHATILVMTAAQIPIQVSEWVHLQNPTDTIVAGADGLYVACNLPRHQRLTVHAFTENGASQYTALMFLDSALLYGGESHAWTKGYWEQHLALRAIEQGAPMRGQIVDSAGQGLPDVTVQAWAHEPPVRTGPNGRFILPHVSPGDVPVQVRRLGFQAEERYVLHQGGDTTDLAPITLRPLPVRLRDIIVEGRAPNRNPHMRGYFERARYSAQGRFVTMENYQRRWGRPTGVTEMISTMRGMLGGVHPRFARCGYPSYYLDGMLVGGGPTFDPNGVIPVDWVVAVEAYDGGVPLDHPVAMRSGCVVLFYTRR